MAGQVACSSCCCCALSDADKLMQSAIYGAFSEPDSKLHEIVVSRGKVLELLRPDENGRMQTVYSSDVFGVIR